MKKILDIIAWLFGYRRCSFCLAMQKDTRPIIDGSIGNKEIVGHCCVNCYIRNFDVFLRTSVKVEK